MGAEGTGVAKEAVGPIDIGTELVMVKTSGFELNDEPVANMDRFSRMSNGEDCRPWYGFPSPL